MPRDSFTVATKLRPMAGNSYDVVKKALTASLERLGLDYVDIYYSHRNDSLEGVLEFAASAKKLKEEGLCREVGFSEIPPAWLEQAHAVCPIAAVQLEWSLLTRSIEDELVPLCKKLGITIVAYSPLARNLLAGEVKEAPKDWRATLPRYGEENLTKNLALVADVSALASKKGCTAAQLSLAWLFKKASNLSVSVVPIPGTTKLQHAKDNIAAAQITLEDSDMAILEELASQVAGNRGDEGYMSLGFEKLSSK